MSPFKPSAETGKDVRLKVLLWGPAGSGKTHFALSSPKPALLDLENRARSFAHRSEEFSFAHAEIATLKELGEAYKELRAGRIDCESIVIDSASAIYLKLVAEHTIVSERGAAVTDWVTVNRRFLDCLNFVFEIHGKNVFFTAHAATKMVRNGRDFTTSGLKFVGDERFRFGFDYIFRIEPKGDPAKTPAIFHVEKSSSPALHLGQAIPGLTYAKLVALTNGTPATTPRVVSAPSAHPEPTPIADDGSPISLDQVDEIEVLSRQVGWSARQLADAVKSVTHRTVVYREMSAAEAGRLINILKQRRSAA